MSDLVGNPEDQFSRVAAHMMVILLGQPYWSKDIIFLVSDHEQIGMQAWLDGYHQVDAKCKFATINHYCCTIRYKNTPMPYSENFFQKQKFKISLEKF